MDLGDRVLYRLDGADAEKINAWRANFAHFNAGMSGHKHPHRPGSPGATGHVAHVGVPVSEGDELYADVCAVPDPESGRLNLRVATNGNDVYLATGVPEGTGPGTWARRD
jgi:hypothetical protein